MPSDRWFAVLAYAVFCLLPVRGAVAGDQVCAHVTEDGWVVPTDPTFGTCLPPRVTTACVTQAVGDDVAALVVVVVCVPQL
jgi:hypothetical protein